MKIINFVSNLAMPLIILMIIICSTNLIRTFLKYAETFSTIRNYWNRRDDDGLSGSD